MNSGTKKRILLLLAALCLVALQAEPSHAVQKWALLIGVNDYTAGPPQWDLRGCENDVLMTKELLTTKFGFPESNIKTLLSAEATAGNIKAAMEDWLIAEVRPEDIVYFHFSGHGSQTKDWDGDEDDGKDELLCPTDMQLGNTKTVITDDELRELFARIKSNNVTIIIDACHSGTGTRDLSLSHSRHIDFEGTGGDPDTRIIAMTATPGGGSYEAAASGVTASASPTPPTPPPLPGGSKLSGTGGMEGGQKMQVTISGCKPAQTSADARIREGFYAGALTYNLIANMKKAPADITYRQLMERVVRDVKAQKYTQLPQIEGDMDRPLFGTPIPDVVDTPFLVIQSAVGNRITVSGGQAQKVSVGSVYAVYPAGETAFVGTGIGQIKITAVHESNSDAVAIESGADISAGQRIKEVLHNADPDKLKLVVEATDPSIAQEVTSSLTSIQFVTVVASDKNHFDHRLQISGGDGALSAALTIDGVPGSPAQAASSSALVDSLRTKLENAYAIKFLANLDNPSPTFGIEVWANRSSDMATRDLVIEALDEAEDEKLVHARLGDIIRFNFRADRDCYLTLINVGTSGKIAVLFPNKYSPDGFIRGGRVYQTETKGDMPFKIRARGPAGRELVKVIATLQPLDLASLRMGKEGGAGTRSIESGSEFAMQLTRDLAAVRVREETKPDATAPAASPDPVSDMGTRDLVIEALDENVDTGVGIDLALLPTEGWATDYLIIETTP